MISHDSPLTLYWEGPNSSKQQGCLISQNSYRDLKNIFFLNLEGTIVKINDRKQKY